MYYIDLGGLSRNTCRSPCIMAGLRNGNEMSFSNLNTVGSNKSTLSSRLAGVLRIYCKCWVFYRIKLDLYRCTVEFIYTIMWKYRAVWYFRYLCRLMQCNWCSLVSIGKLDRTCISKLLLVSELYQCVTQFQTLALINVIWNYRQVSWHSGN